MGGSLISLEEHLSSMVKLSKKATRVNLLVSLNAGNMVAKIKEMKETDDQDAAKMKKDKLGAGLVTKAEADEQAGRDEKAGRHVLDRSMRTVTCFTGDEHVMKGITADERSIYATTGTAVGHSSVASTSSDAETRDKSPAAVVAQQTWLVKEEAAGLG